MVQQQKNVRYYKVGHSCNTAYLLYDLFKQQEIKRFFFIFILSIVINPMNVSFHIFIHCTTYSVTDVDKFQYFPYSVLMKCECRQMVCIGVSLSKDLKVKK